MACEQLFADQLRQHGMRLTAQRARVLHVLHSVAGYATADEIHSLAQSGGSPGDGPVVDRSTVYRTLELLRAFNLVAAIDLGDGQTRYELIGVGQPHLHLVCQGCGAVFVAPMDSVDPLIAALMQRHGFAASLEDVTIPGLCADCRGSSAGETAPAEPRPESSAHTHPH